MPEQSQEGAASCQLLELMPHFPEDDQVVPDAVPRRDPAGEQHVESARYLRVKAEASYPAASAMKLSAARWSGAQCSAKTHGDGTTQGPERVWARRDPEGLADRPGGILTSQIWFVMVKVGPILAVAQLFSTCFFSHFDPPSALPDPKHKARSTPAHTAARATDSDVENPTAEREPKWAEMVARLRANNTEFVKEHVVQKARIATLDQHVSDLLAELQTADSALMRVQTLE
ncbi:hypothetical protein LTR08_001976 [Meristemomyces frigidus]|nr:hypothetical protein LTR08_001976 [Meristemomyces frigidus]